MEEESKEGFKRCGKCGRVLPLADFNKMKSSKDGLQYYCKDCKKAHHTEWYAHNKEAIADYQAQYRQANKEKKAAYNAEYYDPQNNPRGWAKRMVNHYRQMDRQRGFNDNETITAEWFLDNIAYRPCVYCGVQAIGLIGCNRLDNTKGHTEDNVEPCCQSCNSTENIRDQIRRGIHVSCKHKKQSFSDFVNEHLKEKSKK